MPTFNTRRIVDHAPRQMFDLVADIEKYPEFLPMCEDLTIVSTHHISDDETYLTADMTVGYKMLRETFTTQVHLQKTSLIINVKYIDGPFKYLENRWAFHSVDMQTNKCDVQFFLDYEFKNRMLGVIMGSMFDIAFRKFTDAFEDRASKIY